MPSRLIPLKEAARRIVRCVRAGIGQVIPFHFSSVLVGWLIAQANGLELLAYSVGLMIGTALLARGGIYLALKSPFCKPLRNAISLRFRSWPPVLVLFVILFLVAFAISVEVSMLRNIVSPTQSSTFVALGFLYGVTSSLMSGLDRRRENRRDDSFSGDLQAPTWIRYDPMSAQK